MIFIAYYYSKIPTSKKILNEHKINVRKRNKDKDIEIYPIVKSLILYIYIKKCE